VSVYDYLLPDDTDYVQPTFIADRGWLHLETRYNSEDLQSGSVWLGYNFSSGEAIEWTSTPMVRRRLRTHERHRAQLQGVAGLEGAAGLQRGGNLIWHQYARTNEPYTLEFDSGGVPIAYILAGTHGPGFLEALAFNTGSAKEPATPPYSA
jgi:hypothetical protein